MNKRQKDFIEAGIENHIQHCPQMLLRGGYAYAGDNEKMRSKIFEEGAEYGYQYALQHPNWIDVNDELPPKVTNDGKVSKISIKVLVCCKGDKGQDMFILDWYDYEANDWVNADSSLVTHWMKIIPPQK